MNEHLAPILESHEVVKGLAGGPDEPPGFCGIDNARGTDMDALQKALAAEGPVPADIPNDTNTEPIMLIGEVVG